MNRKKSLVGIGLIAALMALTGWLLFRDQPVTRLLHTLGQLRPGWLLLGAGSHAGLRGGVRPRAPT